MADKTKQEKKLKKRLEAIKQRKTEAADDLSDVLLKFCRPLLQEVQNLNGEDNAVGLGVFAWNAAFLTRDRWTANLKRSLEQFSLSADAQETLEGIVEEMIRQKKLMYPNDLRVITHYEVKIENNTIALTVESRVAKKNLLPRFNEMPAD
ncbi:hypothetical protein [Desulfovibrio psychrotolerans]|uniref:Uncharacterized protein n=1 Tax=Desulfovibrio psychrotolerans TaxID=415242 RepID=A0A7J0BZ63_9BACT|nr:hypothetical protein [Desulfovibrio psychrotolerans]GFM38264.1 hypothetical protein DSM19430T_29480 [Desulfovibrio psychrotolerans]